jgi:hypothetical protein
MRVWVYVNLWRGSQWEEMSSLHLRSLLEARIDGSFRLLKAVSQLVWAVASAADLYKSNCEWHFL